MDITENLEVPVIEDGAVCSFKDAKRDFEHAYCDYLLTLTGGNVSAAARLASKDRKDFYDVLKRSNIDLDDYRE
jgi:two-component system response regulator GlrR